VIQYSGSVVTWSPAFAGDDTGVVVA
jgi:hypothetical protein